MEDNKPRYKRTQIIVDRKFQFQFLMIGLITACSTLVLAIALFYFYKKFSRTEINSIVLTYAGGMGAFIILFTLFLGLISTTLLHRVAGAAFRLERSLKEMMKGELKGEIKLRQKDYLQPLAQNLNVLAKELNRHFIELNNIHSELNMLSDPAVSESTKNKLKELSGRIKSEAKFNCPDAKDE